MSYILDALKRADAERSQGAVLPSPGTQPPATREPSPHVPRTRVWIIGAVALVVMVAAAWAWFARSSPTVADADSPPIATMPLPAPVETNPPASEAAASAPAPSTSTPTAAQPSPTTDPVGGKPPAAPVLPILAKAPPAPPPPQAKPPEPKATAAPDATPKAEAKPANAVPALSPAQRAALPQIAVSGSSYSANAAHRMLIANGQVVKEGQELSPGLLLEAIGPHSAIFNQGGMRFNVNY